MSSVLLMSEVNGRPNSIDMTSTKYHVIDIVFIKHKEVRHSALPVIMPKMATKTFALEIANGIMLNGIIPIAINANGTTSRILESG